MCDHCGCRSFPPIAELSAEHEEILGQAWRIAEASRTGTAIADLDVERLVALLDVHVAKEETGLYPALLAGRGLLPEQCGDLEREHRELRSSLTGSSFDRRDYFALAAHIETEEMELFPLAMLGFDEDDWEGLEAAHLSAQRTAGTAR
ncbi:MAG TPA: hemerythrin domain-containing protein [Acidimicrobiales bacterium]